MEFKSFSDFYPYYLREHSHTVSRKLHFVGTCSVVALLLLFFFTGNLLILLLLPLVAYGFAWIGHFLFEKNRSTTLLKYPLWSLMGDFKMFWEIITGKVKAF